MNDALLQLTVIGLAKRLQDLTGEPIKFTNEDFEAIVTGKLAVDFGDSTEDTLVLNVLSETDEDEQEEEEGE